jgi:hypothetical protein
MLELTPEQVEELLRRAAAGALTEEDREIVCSRLRTWRRVLDLLSQEGTTIDDLRELLLGTRGEPSPSVGRDSTRSSAAAERQDGPRHRRASRRIRKGAARRRRRRTQ